MPKKLDKNLRAEIRSALIGGMSISNAAKKYGVTYMTARRIFDAACLTQMDPGEICRDYRAAKDKRAQIKILAELNLMTQTEVARILAADPSSGYVGADG